jgi:3-deoxy-D-manno-octulosonate 8-phosphate phosphatase (KDO 8-P phosphatase)
MNMRDKPRVDLSAIELLVLDVDGVMTDGNVILHEDGSESKMFSTLDCHGIRMWQRAGLRVGLLSGRVSTSTNRRAEQLEIPHVIQGPHYKLPAIEQLLGELGLTLDKVAYVGDDLMDLPVVRRVGFGVAVANAVDELKAHADYVTTRPGGRGAVREVIEFLLKNAGRWQDLMERYLV